MISAISIILLIWFVCIAFLYSIELDKYDTYETKDKERD